ncbi:unnamed protein product [[Candida] boidinii]|nr:hypothetical protein B5S30_g284 [[Candida] boidinii]GMF51183.1 unnamed protein product [[Candida] boidinii]GMF97830.1 unnamed protein product [[Candida] boidinii]
MGQSTSTTAKEDTGPELEYGAKTVEITRSKIKSLFLKDCIQSFKPIELLTLKQKLGLDELVAEKEIPKTQLFELLEFPYQKHDIVSDLLFKHLQFLSCFPNLSEYKSTELTDSITVAGLIKVMALLDKEKSANLFPRNSVQITLDLLFLSFTQSNSLQTKCEETKNFDEKEEISKNKENKLDSNKIFIVVQNDKTKWEYVPQVLSYDGIEINEENISANVLLNVFTFALAIMNITVEDRSSKPLSQFNSNFEHWDDYKSKALNLIRSFDSSIKKSTITEYNIYHDIFIKIVGFSIDDGTMPFVFEPFKLYLQSLLYLNTDTPSSTKAISTTLKMETSSSFVSKTPTTLIEDREEEAKHIIKKHHFTPSRLLSYQTLSQLATFLPPEVVFSRLRKLYVAAESGFSMRSMESKVFKWNAPTIVLVSGIRVGKKPNKRYDRFKDTFPRFHPSSTEATNSFDNENDDSSKITFGIYIKQAWKITNGQNFGNDKGMIFQLEARQNLFKGSKSVNVPHYCYFSTAGGGLGFGSAPPRINANGSKVYSPGIVSLTIDQSMEFCVFRHLGLGGSYEPGSIHLSHSEIPEYEDRFAITDLEVWGCGTDKELAEQAKNWEWEHREAQARQKLNMMNWEDGKALLEMAGLVGRSGDSGGSV